MINNDLDKIVETLENIAKLGNGDKYGNSIGNTMALEILPIAIKLKERFNKPIEYSDSVRYARKIESQWTFDNIALSLFVSSVVSNYINKD